MGKGLLPSEWEKEYQKGNPHWAKDTEPTKFAQDFVKELKKRDANTVLEIGCGNGRDSIFFAKEGFKVSAIDVAPSAVELAKENMKKVSIDINIQEANAESLPFFNAEFDAVFSLSVLHATRLENSLKEVYRVLKSRGYAFIYIYGNTQKSGMVVNETISVDMYLKLLKSLGFIVFDFYTENETVADSFGEKHKLYIAFLEKR